MRRTPNGLITFRSALQCNGSVLAIRPSKSKMTASGRRKVWTTVIPLHPDTDFTGNVLDFR